MDAAALSPARSRGAALLLEHCAALERLTHGRAPAHIRLERALGDELTQLLLFALVGDHRVRPRALVA